MAMVMMWETQNWTSPKGGHGDDGVPEGGGDGVEGGVLDILLAVEHDGGKDDDGHGEAEHEEAELGGAALEGVAKDAESLRVAGELENAEHSEHSEGDEGPAHFVIIVHSEADVIGHDGHEVYNRHHWPHELPPADKKCN